MHIQIKVIQWQTEKKEQQHLITGKYISLYRELITQLKAYVSAIRILSKGYLPTTLIPPNKLQDILAEV